MTLFKEGVRDGLDGGIIWGGLKDARMTQVQRSGSDLHPN